MKRSLHVVLITLLAMSAVTYVWGAGTKEGNGTGAQGTPKTKVLRITFAPAEGSPHHQAALEFGRLVKEKTKGAYTVEAFANSQLAGGNQLVAIQMVQKGSIDFGLLSPPVQSAIIPDLGALSIPWLWKDVPTIDKTLQPGTKVFDLLAKKYEEHGFVLLAFAENGFREVTNSKRELRTPEDFKGLKFRVIGNKMLVDVFTALGANPTDINFAELFTAMQQGTVDGQENPVSTIIIPQRYYEVQKYMTMWDYSYEPHPLEVNKQLWDSFDPATQQAIREAAVEACALQKKLAREAYDADLKKLTDTGMKITTLSPSELQAFKDKAQPAIAANIASFDKDLVAALLDANK